MLEALATPMDLYCERTGPELWSEPFNAVSNLAFVAAGLWGLAAARRHGADATVAVLAWWVVAIGIGSGLFHTFANRLTVWLDILPIAIFTLAYTLFAIRRYLGFAWGPAIAVFVAFYAVAAMLAAIVPDGLREASNGSTGYLPAFLALSVFGLWTWGAGHPAGRLLVAAAGVFVVSVTFRALDFHACEAVPVGTHFLWHILNALMLALLLAAAARHGGVRRQELPRRRA